MRNRQFANTGIQVGAVGLGCMGMSWAYSESARDDETSRQVINAALDLGVTFIDTASVYGVGANERLVGSAITARRDDVFLCTKTGLVGDVETRAIDRDGTPGHIVVDVEGSLRRLGVDVIDLLYLHRVDPAVPLEETWGAMVDFVTAGKVRYLGLSEVGVEEIARAHAIHPVSAVQSELSLWTRDALGAVPIVASGSGGSGGSGGSSAAGGGGGGGGDVVGWCAANGAAFVPFSPLGRGYLTGTIAPDAEFESTDFRAGNPRFSAAARAENERLVDEVRAIAGRIGATPGQVAIAWTLAQGEHIVPIPGTKRLAYLQENAGAADVDLTAEDVARLDGLPPAAGSRY